VARYEDLLRVSHSKKRLFLVAQEVEDKNVVSGESKHRNISNSVTGARGTSTDVEEFNTISEGGRKVDPKA